MESNLYEDYNGGENTSAWEGDSDRDYTEEDLYSLTSKEERDSQLGLGKCELSYSFAVSFGTTWSESSVFCSLQFSVIIVEGQACQKPSLPSAFVARAAHPISPNWLHLGMLPVWKTR